MPTEQRDIQVLFQGFSIATAATSPYCRSAIGSALSFSLTSVGGTRTFSGSETTAATISAFVARLAQDLKDRGLI
jgi:hypothetical protein